MSLFATFGSGDLLVGAIKIDDNRVALTVKEIPERPIGVVTHEFDELTPDLYMFFDCVESVDVVIKTLKSIREYLSEKVVSE